MSDKHELTLADFEGNDLWTWDDVADDGSLVPVGEIPFCDNGEIDLGVLFVRGQCESPDGRQWHAVLGVRPADFSVYWVQVFSNTGSCAWNLHLACDLRDAIAFKETFGDNPGGVFPLRVNARITALNQTVVAEVPQPL